jgi:hypothetical protein
MGTDQTRWERIKAVYPELKILEHRDARGRLTYALEDGHSKLLSSYQESVTQCEWEVVADLPEPD